jgi:hypothetical protein
VKLPKLNAAATTRDVTDTFYGYHRGLKIRAGEMFFTENLTTRDFPMLATRRRRGMVRKLTNPQGLLAKDKLCYVDDGTLYYGDVATPVSGLSAGHKQLVSMGAYVCIFPDKVYYNTQDPTDYGFMEFTRTLTSDVSYALCSVTGAALTYTTSASEPASPDNGDYWYDTANNALKQYSAAQSEWVTIVTVFTKITFSGLGFNLTDYFKEHDGVLISGTAFPDELDGNKALYAVGADYIVVVGLIDVSTLDPDDHSLKSISLRRDIPDLDYVCECQNRLWGCYYGQGKDGKTLNEIYCCALGDFKNWRVYMGLSTDSWTASVGSDGPWTGAINFLGYPTFFKENTIHRVSVSATGAHSIIETPARGVQAGSGASLAIVNEILFYKARTDVVAYQGGFPEGVSGPLGDIAYSDAVGGTFGYYYFVSMKSGSRWDLFVFDSQNKLWMREDDLHLTDIAQLDDSLYALDADGVLWDLAGAVGETETRLPWVAQTGILYYEYPNKKYTSRYDVMMSAPAGTSIRIEIQYDSDGVWVPCGHHLFKGLNTITFPVRPRRCNHMELRLSGEGDVKIYSISRILEQGSDT